MLRPKDALRGRSLSHKTTPVQAHRGFRLLTLAHKIVKETVIYQEKGEK